MYKRQAVTLNKDNYTEQLIEKSGRFSAVVLTQNCGMDIIKNFGFCSSRDNDKFAQCTYRRDTHGVPYPSEHMAARYSLKVVKTLDLGTHVTVSYTHLIGIVSPRSCFEKEKLSRRKPGALHHVAFMVDDTQTVDRLYEQVLQMKMQIVHAPRFYPEYCEDYYAFFLKMCIRDRNTS